MSSSGFFLLCLFLLRFATLEIYHKQSCALLLCFIFCNLSLLSRVVKNKSEFYYYLPTFPERARRRCLSLVEEFRHHRVSFPCLFALCFSAPCFNIISRRQTDEKFHPKAAPQALKETWTKPATENVEQTVVFHTFAFYCHQRKRSTAQHIVWRQASWSCASCKGSREKRESENVEQSEREREKEGKKEKQFFMRFDDESFALSWRMKNWASEGNFRYLQAKVASSFLPQLYRYRHGIQINDFSYCYPLTIWDFHSRAEQGGLSCWEQISFIIVDSARGFLLMSKGKRCCSAGEGWNMQKRGDNSWTFSLLLLPQEIGLMKVVVIHFSQAQTTGGQRANTI